MATKSITVDLEAYNRLKKAKRENESFSETIKRVVPKPFDFDAWLETMRHNGLSDKCAEAVERHVATRLGRSRQRR